MIICSNVNFQSHQQLGWPFSMNQDGIWLVLLMWLRKGSVRNLKSFGVGHGLQSSLMKKCQETDNCANWMWLDMEWIPNALGASLEKQQQSLDDTKTNIDIHIHWYLGSDVFRVIIWDSESVTVGSLLLGRYSTQPSIWLHQYRVAWCISISPSEYTYINVRIEVKNQNDLQWEMFGSWLCTHLVGVFWNWVCPQHVCHKKIWFIHDWHIVDWFFIDT